MLWLKKETLKVQLLPFWKMTWLIPYQQCLITILTNTFYSLGWFTWPAKHWYFSPEGGADQEDGGDQEFSSGHVEFERSIQYLKGNVK